jgi:hypothetical protein
MKKVSEVMQVMQGLEKKYGLQFDYNDPEMNKLKEYIKDDLKFVKKITPPEYKSDVIDTTVTRVFLGVFLDADINDFSFLKQ